MEEELVRSNATRAYLVGYLVSLSYEAIHHLSAVECEAFKAEELLARLEALNPLIDKEFYGGVLRRKEQADHVEIIQGAAARVERAQGK